MYLRSFDLIELKVDDFADIQSSKDFVLIEVKVTGKFLPNFPRGFFFGMTKNEENLIIELGDAVLLCLVPLMSQIPPSNSFIMSNFNHLFEPREFSVR